MSKIILKSLIIHITYLSVTIFFAAKQLPAQPILTTIPIEGNHGHPRAIDVNPRTNRIYVGNSYVHVLNGKTNDSSDTVQIKVVSGTPVKGVEVNPKTNRIYIAYLTGEFYVINGKKNKIIDIVKLWNGSNVTPSPFPPLHSAEGVAVNPITNRIYVAHSRNIIVLDGEKNQVIDTIRLRGIDSVQGVEVNHVTNRIYVAGSALSVIDGKTNKVIKTIPIKSKELTINHLTNRIYVAGDVIRIIDGRTNRVIDTVKLKDDSFSNFPIEVNVRTNRVYIADPNFDTLSVIDGNNNKVINTIKTGKDGGPQGIAVNPITGLIYVTRLFEDDVIVIKDTGTKLQTINPLSIENSFTINSNNLQIGAAGLEKLVLNSGEDEKCVLKLTHLEPGVSIEVTTNLMKSSQSPIKVNPESGITDAIGEIEFTISAVSSGEGWIEWAVLNENGEFDFSKEAYDAGTAWGMFVEVR